MKQQQFLEVIDRDEAERRFRAALDLTPLAPEPVPLGQALGRVLAARVRAPVDVPNFDRSNVDGFALQAEDTFGASEDEPALLGLHAESIRPGVAPASAVACGLAVAIATGGMLPRGANAVVMVEDTEVRDGRLVVRRPVTPGQNVTFAGTDIGAGETVLWPGTVLTSRETGVLAALGLAEVQAVRRPRVAVLSTGDEIIPPGEALRPGAVYDSNAVILADAVRELGGEPILGGIVPDDPVQLRARLEAALACDVVLLSGGTSKGEGDVSYRVVAELGPPGVVAHGVALKPGKPLCLAAVRRGGRVVPVAVLPGFPTSAIFTFHEFLAPVVRALAGRPPEDRPVVQAKLPIRVNSERGRTEYLLVSLVRTHGAADGQAALTAFPMGKGSGSVTAFSRADGFVTIPRQQEYVAAGSVVEVQLLARELQPADLIVIGSHCVGLDLLLGRLQRQGMRVKFLAVGSTGGLEAVRRGECDLAGVHLLDPETDTYNLPFIDPATMELIPGYRRRQGVVFRAGDPRFAGKSAADAVGATLADPECILVNRNRGSGTRLLIDRLLGAARPRGYSTEAKSHNAAASAVAQGRADWGVAIETVARQAGLGFLPLREERYDFVVANSRRERPAVAAFCALVADPGVRQELQSMGFGA